MGLGGDNMANKFIDRTGETNINKQGLKMTIIKYNGHMDIDVGFEDGYISTNKSYTSFKNGSIKNVYYRDIYGIACIGNATSNYNNIKKKPYNRWFKMLQRCYDEDFKKEHPTYNNCYVCDEWLCYENFEKWWNEHYYELEGEWVELDKDILIKGNKVYSPETCVFVPKAINILFKKHKKESNLPLGVYFHRGKYTSQLNEDSRKRKWLGDFNTPEEAFYAYKEAKEKEIKRVADLYKDKIPQKLYEAMYSYEVEITD